MKNRTGICIGGMTVPDLIRNELRLSIVEKALKVLLEENPEMRALLDLQKIRNEALKDLKEKYPDSIVIED